MKKPPREETEVGMEEARDSGEDRGRDPEARVLYCRCAYAKVVPEEVKDRVLGELCGSGMAFDAVSDLCDLSARKDPSLSRLAAADGLRIVACYPRAVKWLFHAAKTPLRDDVEVLNMREESGEEIVEKLLGAPKGEASEVQS